MSLGEFYHVSRVTNLKKKSLRSVFPWLLAVIIFSKNVLLLYNFLLGLDLKLVAVPVAEEDDEGDVAELDSPDFLRADPLLTLRGRASEPDLFSLQEGQYQISGMADFLTLTQLR